MKAKSQVNRFYPERSNYQSDQQFQEVRNLYDMVYQMHDTMTPGKPDPPSSASSNPGGPSTTKIGGLYVEGVPPSHGAAPTYNQTSGQFEYLTAGGSNVPSASSSPGFEGQIATDGTHLYIAVSTGSGTNTWKRVSLSTF
jgi:hypothetical protein